MRSRGPPEHFTGTVTVGSASDRRCTFAGWSCRTLRTTLRPERSALRVRRMALSHPAKHIAPPAIRIACSPHRIVAPFRPHFAPSDPHCVFAASRCCPPHTAFPSAIGIPCRATSEVGFSVPSHGEHLFESYVGSTLERTDLDPMDLSEGIMGAVPGACLNFWHGPTASRKARSR